MTSFFILLIIREIRKDGTGEALRRLKIFSSSFAGWLTEETWLAIISISIDQAFHSIGTA
jgi:hypothetical protein